MIIKLPSTKTNDGVQTALRNVKSFSSYYLLSKLNTSVQTHTNSHKLPKILWTKTTNKMLETIGKCKRCEKISELYY